MGSYAASSIFLTIGTIPITGFADESFCRIEQIEDALTLEEDVNANATFNHRKTCKHSLEITLQDGSESNDYLSALYIANQKFPGSGQVPIAMKDLLGRTFFTAVEGAPVKLPSTDHTNENAAPRVWRFLCAVEPGGYFPGGR